MKISHEVNGDAVSVRLGGELDSLTCNCVEAFWRCHIGDDLAQVAIDMADVDAIDGESIAVLVGIIRRHLTAGAQVVVRNAPQMLAHTLYKTGTLTGKGLRLDAPRADEQPYA